jgi:hypothetical protein
MNKNEKTRVGTAYLVVKMAFTNEIAEDESPDEFLEELIRELPISIGDGIPLFTEFLGPKAIPA